MANLFPEEEDLFPLSRSQRNIWDLEQTFPGTSMNNISATIRIRGRIDISVLQTALNTVLAADDSLRARITLRGKTPLQYHAPFSALNCPVLDFSLTNQEGIEHWETAVTREAVPLLDSPLCHFYLFRDGENSGGMLVKTHHIVSDGWSQLLLCNRIAQTYLSLLRGQAVPLDACPDYRVHVEEEEAYLTSRTFQKDLDYWTRTLAEAGPPSTLKTVRGAVLSPVGRRRTFRLPEVLNHAIYSFCTRHRVAPFAVYYMALAIYLKRMGGPNRFTIGVPIHNRTNYTARQTSGMFVSTLPFCNELDEDWTPEQFVRHLNEAWYGLLRHQRFPFSEIEALPRPHADRLFHIALSYQDSKIYESEDASVVFSGRWHYGGYQAEHLCIHLTNLEDHRRYTVDYDYLTQLFSDREIEVFHEGLCHILEQALSATDRPIRALNILTTPQREQVLYTFNRREKPLRRSSLYQAFSAVADHYPARTAVIAGGVRTSYARLRELALSCCAQIVQQLPEGKELTAILLPRGLELLTAMVGVMASGNAWVLLSPALPRARLEQLLASSGAALLVTDQATLAACGGPFALPSVCLDPSVPPGEPLTAEPGDLAYVVYTSGSTGTPKGVCITQENLLNFVLGMEEIYTDGAVLSLTNLSFDAFLLESAVPLLLGRTIVIATDEEAERPAQLARLIQSYGVHYMALTPSRLSAFLAEPKFAAALSGMRAFICGGEAFPGSLLTALKQVTDADLYNQYGPSETTVGVSVSLLNHCDAITVGRPMPNCRLYVLDDRMQPLPIGVFGDLYIGGKCVGAGYRNAPELTEAAFLDDPFVVGGRIYRSGDVACWTADGQLVLGGRRDRQVKLRGQRVEPDELAVCLAGHPEVEQAAARVFEVEGQAILAAFYTAPAALPASALMEFLAGRLPVYLLPAALTWLPALPLTPNGKVDLAALPAPAASRGDRAAANDVEETILAVFRRVLHKPDLGTDSDYFLSGGNSLNAMETVAALEEALDLRLKVSDLYACRTVLLLEEKLTGQPAGDAPPAEPALHSAPRAESYPLSPIQENIYVQCSMAPDAMAYHMPGAFQLSFVPDPARLEAAFQSLIDQDDLYRTAFRFQADGLRQVILEQVPFALPILEAPDLNAAFSAFLQPFDLSTPPLLRAALWQADPQSWYLLVDVHHIVGDGVSTPLLFQRLDALYQGQTVPVPLTYKDYCVWRAALPGQEEEAAHWARRLAPLPEPLELPTDFPRDHQFDFRGGCHTFALSAADSEACRAFCQAHQLTPFMYFAAVFGLLLARLSGKADLIVGTPVSERTRTELWSVCGPFINTLPLRLSPGPSQNGLEYLSSVRDETIHLLDHQRFSLDQVIASLGLPRTVGENPLYQVLFSYRPLDPSTFTLNGLPLVPAELSTSTAKLDLSLEAAEEGDTFTFRLEYATRLFQPETAAFWARCFTVLCRALAARSEEPLSALSPLDPADRLTLLERPRRLSAPFWDVPVDEMVAQTARLDPDAPAVRFHDRVVAYGQLDRRAGQIAALLVSAGAKPGDRIALACARTPDLPAALLGILRAGCAYVPFLTTFPAARIGSMLESAQTTLVLCDDTARAALDFALSCPLVSLADAPEEPLAESVPHGGDDLMCVLFTSGSTGQPKGVMIPHRSMSNLQAALAPLLEAHPGNVLCSSNLVFDVFFTECLLPLTLGRTMVLADEEEMMLPWRLAQRIQSGGVSVMQLTPSRLQMCLSNDAFRVAAARIALLIVAGEAFPARLLADFHAAGGGQVANLYGPTEAAVYVTGGLLEEGAPVTIGRPLNNCRVYVLDDLLQPVLPTAVGQLYLAGVCLARGYIGRPDLTEAAFLPDPFFPGQLMYRTGDLGRLRVDATIDFLGRKDSQIKLNGQRIELEEINGALLSSGLVAQAVTLSVPLADGSASLRAFVTAKADWDEAALRRHLAQTLPAYMIPADLILLPQIPATATGKVDLAALRAWTPEVLAAAPALQPAPVPQPEQSPAARTEALAPAPSAGSDLTHTLAQIWQDVLGRVPEPGLSFFQQGGTSLAALNVLSRYYNQSLSMTLETFYAHPTLEEQAALLAPEPADSPVLVPGPAQTAPVPATVPAAPAPAAEPPRRGAPSEPVEAPMLPARTVLLTGATGFLGAHLLRSLLEHGAQTVVCLLRDPDRTRLDAVLTAYFGPDWLSAHGDRIECVTGNITRPRLGLSVKDYQALAQRIDAVFHAAADVRHYASDVRSLSTNVVGTSNVADLALAAGAPLGHVSTLSICGDHITAAPDRYAIFSETDYDIGQNWQENIYLKGKFLAEGAVYDRIPLGLAARVFRVGRLVGRASDGTFQQNPDTNAFFRLLRAVAYLGALPVSAASETLDLTPVDFCADAIVALANAPLPVSHIVHPAQVTLGQAVRAVCPTLRLVSPQEFSSLLGNALQGEGLSILAPLVDLSAQAGQASHITPCAGLTCETLSELGVSLAPAPPATLLRAFAAQFSSKAGERS